MQHIPVIMSSPPPDPHGVWLHSHHMDSQMLFPAYGDTSLCRFYQTLQIPNPNLQRYYDPAPTHIHSPHYHHSHFSNKVPHCMPQSQYRTSDNRSKSSKTFEKKLTTNCSSSMGQKSRGVDMRGPLHEWRNKIPSPRYDSDDSGIAESPNSITSSMTWRHFDEMEECKNFSRMKISKFANAKNNKKNSEGSSNQLIKTVPSQNESFWSVVDDEKFWRRLRQKPPSNCIINRIADQVEYYLSDNYLLKDKYLLRQIRCKKDGYVSIKLITSFKKVKKLTKDWAVVRCAIVRRSKTLVVSPEGLRIKRRQELSETLKKPRLLTSILVIRLPEEYNSVDSVTSLFSGFGEIEYVRLLRTDKSVPTDLRNYATQVPDIGHSLCAVVDFESAEDALNAVRTLKNFQKSPCGEAEEVEFKDEQNESITNYGKALADLPPLGDMRLALLGPRVRRTLYRQDRASESTEDDGSLPSLESDCQDDESPIKNISLPSGNEKNSPRFFNSRQPKILSRKSHTLNGTTIIRQPKGPEEGKGFKKREKSTKCRVR